MGHTTVQDGMTIDWDVDIPVDDGVVLKGDVFRPISGEPCPVLLTYGPYAKGLSFQQGYPSAWVVPWAILWLFYYEEWLVSDDWKGGGEHPHAPEVETRASKRRRRHDASVTQTDGAAET